MIRVGPSGWNYKDWKGVVYPKPAPRGFDELANIAKYFTTVEINSSFYGPPHPGAARKRVASVSHNEDFRLRPGSSIRSPMNGTPDQRTSAISKTGIAPILEADRLGAIIIQFPWSFKNEPGNRDYLWQLRARFKEYPLVVEVRMRVGSRTTSWTGSQH